MNAPPFYRAAQFVGLFAALLGAIPFLGWILDVPIMRCFVPGRSDVKFNTTLGLMAAGLALFLRVTPRGWRNGIGQWLAALLVVLGAATFAQYAFSVSLGIDEFLMKDLPNAIGTTSPGRMSPQTTITFMFLGLALLYLDTTTRRGHQPSQGFALLAAMFPLQLLIHHLYGGNMVLGFGAAQYSLMAIPTTLALLSVSAGVLLARPKLGWMNFVTSRSFAGSSLRRLLLLGIVLPSLIGAVILFVLDGRGNPPSFAISAFAMFTTLAFCALMAQHTRRLHCAEVEREKAEADRQRTLAELQTAHALLNDRARQLESLVQQRTTALTDANQQLETFAFSIAHDLRAPIRAQNGFARVLEDDYADRIGPEGQRTLQRIRQNADRLGRMVEDLLNYARVGKGDWHIESVPLGPLLNAVREDLASELQASGGTLGIQPTDAIAEAHRATLTLCVMNLFSNAIKFTQPGVPPNVRVWVEPVDGIARIFVRDDGIGIAREQQEKIFGVFQRLHSPSQFPGTGIGLALVRRGVERMGGKVTVNSTPGGGSTFCLELQRVVPEQQRPQFKDLDTSRAGQPMPSSQQ